MEPEVKQFWLGATWLVTLVLVSVLGVMVVITGLIWGDRYLQFNNEPPIACAPASDENEVISR